MNNENFQNEEEILTGGDAKVREMLGVLPRVDAPNDFDFRLKARIAASGAKYLKPRGFPALRVAAPLALALAVLAFIAIAGIYSVNDNSVPQVAEGDVPMPNANKNQPQELVAGNPNPEPNLDEKDKPKDAEIAANPDKPRSQTSAENNNGGGSRDTAVKDPNVVLQGGFETKNSFAVKDILEIIGIDASFSNKKWRVKSVRTNSPAERKGVKAGDTVEAINDIALPAETITLNGPFTGKKLTIARGGAKMEIDLQNP